jgi:hypothetical protein
MEFSYSDLNLTKRKFILYLRPVLKANLSFRQPCYQLLLTIGQIMLTFMRLTSEKTLVNIYAMYFQVTLVPRIQFTIFVYFLKFEEITGAKHVLSGHDACFQLCFDLLSFCSKFMLA